MGNLMGQIFDRFLLFFSIPITIGDLLFLSWLVWWGSRSSKVNSQNRTIKIFVPVKVSTVYRSFVFGLIFAWTRSKLQP